MSGAELQAEYDEYQRLKAIEDAMVRELCGAMEEAGGIALNYGYSVVLDGTKVATFSADGDMRQTGYIVFKGGVVRLFNGESKTPCAECSYDEFRDAIRRKRNANKAKKGDED